MQHTEEPPRSRATSRRLTQYVAAAVGLAAIALAQPRLDALTGPALHTSLEVSATVLALVIGGLALLRFYSRKSNTFLFIGTGFLSTAALDGYHAIITSPSIAHMLPSGLDALVPWSWTASRTFLAVLLGLSWLLWRRQQRLGAAGALRERQLFVLVLLLLLGCASLFTLVPLPRAYFPDLMIHRPEELVPGLLFVLALAGYLHKRAWQEDGFEHCLVLCLLLSVWAQLVFMPFSRALFDLPFVIAHLLKNASYLCVFVGLLTSVYHSFRQADAKADELERRVAERTAELEAANSALESFASSASHDLRQPLRTIDGFSQLLARRYDDALDERGKEYLTRVRAAVQRMGRLIDGLLRLSRARQATLQREDVDLADIARRVAGDLRAMDSDRQVRFDIAERLPAHADPGLAENLLENLLGNAWKFTAQVPEARITIGLH